MKNRKRVWRKGPIAALLVAVSLNASGAAPAFSDGDLEFFEKKIRPLLASACSDCHSQNAERLKGGLYLDSREGILRGGDSGPAAVAGDTEASLLVEVVRYQNVDLQMPPKTKLRPDQIADLERWVALGLPWPAGESVAAGTKKPEFDLEARRRSHWAWQPVQGGEPPKTVAHEWERNPIDAFVLHRLEDNNLAPAEETSRRSLLRRLSYGLTGLPPSVRELQGFEKAYGEGAYEEMVDRYLASPQFGERWARHWLDLVRYAETMGHEFDYTIPNAWRYRDYLIRAFNEDVPYDNFVREHLAGDLLASPRRSRETGRNESVIGTGFYWLGQQVHSPVDIEMNQLDLIDNQIDVLSKTFLAMTVSCARCHDHKFDAISTRDFYSFYGSLSSSRYHETAINPPATWARSLSQLRKSKSHLHESASLAWQSGASKLGEYVSAGIKLLGSSELGEDGVRVAKTDLVFEDFEAEELSGWEGNLEGLGVTEVSASRLAGLPEGNRVLTSRFGDATASAAPGKLISQAFVLDRRYVHILVAGGNDRRRTAVNLKIDDKVVGTVMGRRDNTFRPARFDVQRYSGQEARLELVDEVAEDWGFVAVDQVVLSDREKLFGVGNEPLPALESIHSLAQQEDLNADTLLKWVEILDDSKSDARANPLLGFAAGTDLEAESDRLPAKLEPVSTRQTANRKTAPTQNFRTFADIDADGFAGWFFDGPALQDARVEPGEVVLVDGNPALQTAASIHSGRHAARLQGSLRSPTFPIDERYLHVYTAGRGSRVNVVIDNFNLIRAPIYGGLKKNLNHTEPRWVTFDLEMWRGHDAYLEFKDTELGDLAGGPSSYSPEGWFAVSRVVWSPDSRVADSFSTAETSGGGVSGWNLARLEGRVNDLESETQRLLERWATKLKVAKEGDDSEATLNHQELGWLAWLIENELLVQNDGQGQYPSALRQYGQAAQQVERPVLVPSMTEGSGVDHPIFVRGNPRRTAATAGRGYLEALGASEVAGSGRLALAETLVDSKNPLTARVYVNRVWHHLFGRGIVPSTDNFGVLGDEPSHPELLDWLAHWFMTEGKWSTKSLIRMVVTSSTYRMASQSDAYFEARDPTNRWLHRFPVRRLESEAIRDTILQVSGDLRLDQFGKPVPVHLTPFMTGRGRPGRKGPLDGEHRRTIYQEVRRNFLSPMMQTFDAPIPHTTFGKRAVSNVPAQALILMNDPFVLHQAKRWANRLLSTQPEASDEAMLEQLYREALGRAPSRQERRNAAAFIAQQTQTYAGDDTARLSVWADLCHVVFNLKEFIFLD